MNPDQAGNIDAGPRPGKRRPNRTNTRQQMSSVLGLGIVAVLAVILAVLAVLQYRWIGQASEADRERIQLALNTSAAQFVLDLRRELLQPARAFAIGPREAGKLDWDQYAKRYEDWANSATEPELVKSVYLAAVRQGRLELMRLEPGKGWQPLAWPTKFEALRIDFEQVGSLLSPDREGRIRALRSFNAVRELDWNRPQPDTPAARETIVRFRTGSEVKPDRNTQRPFVFPGGRDHGRVWTLHENIPALSHMLIQYEVGGELPTPPRFAGALVLELDKAYLQSALLPELSQKHFGTDYYRVEFASTGEPREVLYNSGPDLADGPRTHADVHLDLLGPLPAGMDWRGRTGDRFQPMLLPDRSEGSWELNVQHPSGSVETAVAGLRWRNLAVSFSVLLLLGVTMAMLVASSQRAQRLARLQMEFVAGVSHEFRTPLSVICSAADNLAEGVVDTSPRVKQYGKLVLDQGRRLREMVEQILLFASGKGSRRYEIKPVDVEVVVEDALKDCALLIRESGFQVEKRISPLGALADGSALKQCIQILIGNALKYGGESRWIGVTMESQGGRAKITVEDRGLGIERADLPHIFEPFYRGQAAISAQIHGTGLGLSLAKEMIEAMEGSISVKSSPGKGSSFTLYLKTAAISQEAQA